MKKVITADTELRRIGFEVVSGHGHNVVMERENQNGDVVIVNVDNGKVSKVQVVIDGEFSQRNVETVKDISLI